MYVCMYVCVCMFYACVYENMYNKSAHYVCTKKYVCMWKKFEIRAHFVCTYVCIRRGRIEMYVCMH